MRHPREAASEHRTLARRIVRCVVPILILAGGLGAMYALGNRQQETRPATDEESVLELETLTVIAHTGGLDIEVDGIVTPFREIQVASEVMGRIDFKADECRAGNFVRQGTLLVEIYREDYELDVSRYKQQYDQAQAEIEEIEVETGSDNKEGDDYQKGNVEKLVELARQEFDIRKAESARISNPNIYSQSEIDQAKRAVIASQNAWQVLCNQLRSLNAKKKRLAIAKAIAKIQLEKAELDLERTRIFAPVDGVIVSEMVEKDSYVQMGAPLFAIEDTSSVEVQCNLRMGELYWLWHQEAPGSTIGDKSQVAYQIPSTKATVFYQMAGRSDLKYSWEGVLSRYDGIGIDERTRTIPCRIVVSNPQKVTFAGDQAEGVAGKEIGPPALVRGMYVSAIVHADPKTTFVKVPVAAIQPGKYVWRVKDGKLEKRGPLALVKELVETDEQGKPLKDDQDEIVRSWLTPSAESPEAESGIFPGDHLVAKPVTGMRDGMTVREKAE